MITERMTPQEIAVELLTDYPNVSDFADKLLPKFRRIVIKTNKFPVIVHKKYKSKRNNTWIVILRAYSKKDLKDLTLNVYTFSYYDTDRGYYTAATMPKGVIIYTSHFFSRYAQRKEINLHGIELITHFFYNNMNCVTATKEVKLPDGTKQTTIEGSLEEGVLLGLKLPDNIILARTFITKDMAKGYQINNFPIYDIWREELVKNGHKLE